MAIRASPGQRLPLSGIYAYIAERFPFYRGSSRQWQNTSRPEHAAAEARPLSRCSRGLDLGEIVILLFEPPGSLRGSCSSERAGRYRAPSASESTRGSCTGQSSPHAGNLLWSISFKHDENSAGNTVIYSELEPCGGPSAG
ncbi:hypothetical protein DV515_00014638 [Chloebia gouldiae]|uniref:Fork-head domain-containing protein n=1 Tax=Chloebia gouldiae TaxID=44316 RepID=A0A3L8RZ50_CHLGU|nr:hypothetical protein DV515_00014638 [Chloebia gouldiae]